MCRQNPFFIYNSSWIVFNFVQVCQCKLMKHTTKWPNTPVTSASKKNRLCKQLMQSSNGSTLLLTHSGVPCSVLNPSSRLAFGSCWLSKGEKQWLNYWTNQGPRLCIYMILVMRPLEIRLSVVERNKIFINAEVCVWVFMCLIYRTCAQKMTSLTALCSTSFLPWGAAAWSVH